MDAQQNDFFNAMEDMPLNMSTAWDRLNTYAEDDNFDQALNQATKQSRTEMSSAVPPQMYLEDTRVSKWTMQASSGGLSNDSEMTALLSSAHPIDIYSTRVQILFNLHIPAGAAADTNYVALHPIFALLCYTYGVYLGTNGSSIIDYGTTQDQPWLNVMRWAKRNFSDTDLVMTVTATPPTDLITGADYIRNAVLTNAPRMSRQWYTFPTSDVDQDIQLSVQIRPPHNFFAIKKCYPPNIPLKMLMKNTVDSMNRVILNHGGAAGVALDGVVLTSQIDYIRSDELYFTPTMNEHIKSNFTNTATSNMNRIAVQRGQPIGSGSSTLYDPTYGFPNYNPDSVGALYQYETNRLFSATISGASFYINPVTSTSARPKTLVVAFPRDDPFPAAGRLPYTSSLYPNNVEAGRLTSFQVLYNGQTIWDSPITDAGYLYGESKKNVGGEKGLMNWFTYDQFRSSYAFIVVHIAASHNMTEVQPNMSCPIEIQGQFGQAMPPMSIRVGLFYDQTLSVMKTGAAVSSLPIY